MKNLHIENSYKVWSIRKMKKNIGWRAIILVAVLGIMFTYMGVKDSIKLAKDPINMDTTDWGTLKAGDHVQITIDMIWGQVYTETTEETTFGITTNSRESGRGYREVRSRQFISIH